MIDNSLIETLNSLNNGSNSERIRIIMNKIKDLYSKYMPMYKVEQEAGEAIINDYIKKAIIGIEKHAYSYIFMFIYYDALRKLILIGDCDSELKKNKEAFTEFNLIDMM